MNVRDSEIICGLLKAEGYKLTAHPDEADVIIFNTCSVRQHAEDKVWSEVGRFKKQGQPPSGTFPLIGVVGCMAQNYKDDIFRRAPQVDFVVGPSDIHKIPQIIDTFVRGSKPMVRSENLLERKIWETDGGPRPEEIYHTGFYGDKNHAYVVISEGCSNFCSYCVVPHVRGALRNRNYKDILREIKGAIEQGITRFTLLGQNVNAYLSAASGRQSSVNFIELLEMVNGLKGIQEFSFVTSHPKDATIELFKGMRDCGKLKKYLHLPIQSGSNRILGLMNRGYTREFYLELVNNYRKIVKDAVLTTDIIVGFPGETEKDFQDTCDLVRGIEFNAAYIFKYSTRPHTQAEKMVDDVPQQEKEKRHALVLGLQKDISKKSK